MFVSHNNGTQYQKHFGNTVEDFILLPNLEYIITTCFSKVIITDPNKHGVSVLQPTTRKNHKCNITDIKHN